MSHLKLDNVISMGTRVWIILGMATFALLGFLGGLAYSASTVDRLVVEGTKAAWASVEPKVAARTKEIQDAAAPKVAQLTKAAMACAKHEGSQVLQKFKSIKWPAKPTHDRNDQ